VSEITILEPSENLPIIGQHERNGRNAVTLWLQGFRSETPGAHIGGSWRPLPPSQGMMSSTLAPHGCFA
jgi:hypothetical protein